MKNLFTSSLMLAGALAFATPSAQAAVLRVNNTPGVNAPYATVAAALAAAATGDIIQLEPSNTNYGAITVNQNVTIMGTGWLLGTGQNTGLQYTALEASCGAVTFTTGAEGARLTGLRVLGNININVSDVTVERNLLYIQGSEGNWNSGGYDIIINGGAAPGTNDVFIRQNWLYSISGTGTSSNFNIANNIVSGGFTLPATMSGLLTHNIFNYNPPFNNGGTDITVHNSLVTNNIIIKESGTNQTNNPIYYNRFAGGVANNNTYTNNSGDYNATFPNNGLANVNNINSTSAASLFLLTGTLDGRFTLDPAPSPGRASGTSGVDMGIFGGVQPFVLGGIPNFPTIYQLNTNVSGTNLNVTVGTKSNN